MNQQTFNKFFEVFQKEISDFAQKSGGIRDNARVITRRGLPATVELKVAYSGFKIGFFYHAGGINGAKSVVSCLFYKTGDDDGLAFLPNDVMNEIDENDFSRYIFSYLYDEEQVRRAIDCLCTKVQNRLEAVAALFADDARYERLRQQKKEDINELFGRDAFLQAEELGDGGKSFLMRAYDIYYNSVVSRFSSYGYARLIAGDKIQAKKRYSMFHHLTPYEKKLRDKLDDESFTVPDEPDCLVDGIEAESALSMLAPLFVLCLISMTVQVPIFYGLYMLIAFLLGNGALYSTAYEFYNAVYVLLPAAVVSCIFVLSRREYLPYFCLPDKRRLILRYSNILFTKRKPIARWLVITLVALSVFFTMLIANNGARFYGDRVLINPTLTSLRPVEYRYSEIEKTDGGQITFSDGKTYDFSMVGDVERIEEILK